MLTHLKAIREAFDSLRAHVRPEADHLAGSMAVALDQADEAAAEYDFADNDEEVELVATAPKKTTKRGK